MHDKVVPHPATHIGNMSSPDYVRHCSRHWAAAVNRCSWPFIYGVYGEEDVTGDQKYYQVYFFVL
jgi:hypothetical protein